MLRVVGLLLLVAVYIYFVIDVIRTPRGEVRSLPKVVWLLVVVFVPIVGGLLWLWLGRDWPSFGFRFGRRAPLAPGGRVPQAAGRRGLVGADAAAPRRRPGRPKWACLSAARRWQTRLPGRRVVRRVDIRAADVSPWQLEIHHVGVGHVVHAPRAGRTPA
ncbi:MAG: PLDc N-terminal domain-containing protein [Candidatus Nanopelagicales bacterium]